MWYLGDASFLVACLAAAHGCKCVRCIGLAFER